MTNEALKAIAANHNLGEDQISVILNALSIKTENPNKVQLNGFERVCDLMKGGTPLEEAAQVVTTEAKTKTTVKDDHKAAQTVTVAEREAQLQEIAVRHAIAHERIPEILGAMKLKLETLTDSQITVFGDVCQMLNSGMGLDMASQSAANNAKAEAKAKPTAKNFPEPAPDAVIKTEANGHDNDEAALAVVETHELLVKKEKALRSFPPDIRVVLEKYIHEQAQKMVKQMPSKAGGQVKRSVARFEAQLWDELGETCDSLLQVNVYQMMNTPEFAQEMESALSDPQA
jgi:hypothetical protein